MPREYLKKLREQRNMSMQIAADKIGITRQYYQQIEAGERQKKMDVTLVIALSNLFEITPEQVIMQEQNNTVTK